MGCAVFNLAEEKRVLWKGHGGRIIKLVFLRSLGLALTYLGCHLSRQANGIQVLSSHEHIWKPMWDPGATIQ